MYGPCSISWNQSLCNLYIILETMIESNLVMLEHLKALYLMHSPLLHCIGLVLQVCTMCPNYKMIDQ